MAGFEGKVGPFRLRLYGTRDGAGIYFGIGGALWDRVYAAGSDWSRRHRNRPAGSSPVKTGAVTPAAAEKLRRIDGQGWYHTLDLGEGVRTDGLFDHMPHLEKYRFPESLHGLRVLDIGSFDGFWAFEFERRGAAEVVAWDAPRFADLDFPPSIREGMLPEELDRAPGTGFALAIELLQSRVQRRFGSIYALSPEQVGTFDLTHMGNVLVHLRDPAGALQRMAAVTSGEAWVVEAFEPEFGSDASVMRYMGGQQDCNWWRFSVRALRDMVADAGFSEVEEVARFAIPFRNSNRLMNILVLRARGSVGAEESGSAIAKCDSEAPAPVAEP